MRCPKGGTEECKVHSWTEELLLLRKYVLECGLKEVVKWGVPCYTHKGSNVLIVSAFKDFACLSFFKGALIQEDNGFLVKPGKHSQASRFMQFTEVQEIEELESIIKSCIREAIEIENKGLKVEFKKNPEPIPEELTAKMEEDPSFKTAFEALTPGRQRGYIIHFSQPKQSKTRIARIEKWTEKILNGEGMHDKYQSMKRKKK